MDNITKKLMQRSESTRKDTIGRAISMTALILIAIVVVSIFVFVLSRGLSTFYKDGVNVKDFLFGTTWNPSVTDPATKALYWRFANDFGLVFSNILGCHCRNTICNWYCFVHD